MSPHPPEIHWAMYLGILTALVLVCAFFAASETGLLSVRDSRISQLVDEGNKRARIVESLRDRPERMLVTIQIVVTFVTTLASALATEVAFQVLPKQWAVPVSTVLVLFFLSLLGEITPKNWAVGNAERVALVAAPVVKLFSNVIVFPLVWLLETLSSAIIRLLGGHRPSTTQFPTEQEIKLIVEEGARFGELEHEEKEMIHKVMEIPGITAREIMTPRIQMVGVEVNTPLPEVIALVVEEGHTRIPVYRRTVDDIVGILHAKDLLTVFRTVAEDVTLEQLMKVPLQVPESKKVDKLLKEFKVTKSQMAVVFDEYGGTAGVVTMEDVLEEIVGPIGDEYDEPDEKDIETVTPGEYIVAGAAGLEDVMEALVLSVKTDDAEGHDTIGGLVVGLLGRVPCAGDQLEYEGWSIIVDKVQGRRVDRVHMTRLNQQSVVEER